MPSYKTVNSATNLEWDVMNINSFPVFGSVMWVSRCGENKTHA